MKVTVLVPTYNEINTIREILKRVQAEGIAEEILVVDDGSTDGTRRILQDLDGQDQIKVFLHDNNSTPKNNKTIQPVFWFIKTSE